jgi:hypothetical protein
MDENNFNFPQPQEEMSAQVPAQMPPEMMGASPFQGQEMMEASPFQEPEMPEGTPVQGGTPYFMGDQAIVKFSSGEGSGLAGTYWLVDKANKTIRPFESETALKNAIGPDFTQLKKNIMKVSPPMVDENNEITDGILKDFTILDPDYSVKEDGTASELRFSPSQLKKRYGQPIDENAEGLAAEALDGLLNVAKKEKGLNIDKIKKDSKLVAFYISALAYGKYTLANVYTDIIKRIEE